MSPTKLSLACQAPELKCSFCWLKSNPASKPASPGHAPELSLYDHLPLHRGHVRGRAQQGMLTTASGRRLSWVGGVVVCVCESYGSQRQSLHIHAVPPGKEDID